MPSLLQMESDIIQVYPSLKWNERVSRMPSGQVVAIWYRFMREGKFNKTQSVRTKATPNEPHQISIYEYLKERSS